MKKLITNWISNVKELRAHLVLWADGDLRTSPATLSAYLELLRSGYKLNELLRLNMGSMFVSLGLPNGGEDTKDVSVTSILLLVQGEMSMDEFITLIKDCINKDD